MTAIESGANVETAEFHHFFFFSFSALCRACTFASSPEISAGLVPLMSALGQLP